MVLTLGDSPCCWKVDSSAGAASAKDPKYAMGDKSLVLSNPIAFEAPHSRVPHAPPILSSFGLAHLVVGTPKSCAYTIYDGARESADSLATSRNSGVATPGAD